MGVAEVGWATSRRLVARWLWRSPRRWIRHAELAWSEHGRVTYCGPPRERGLPECAAVVPGWVNAHVHLQLPPLERIVGEPFPSWIGRVIAAREERGATGADPMARAHLAELWAGGCTAVGEIDSTGTSPAALRAFPLAGRCYREVLGFDVVGEAAAAEVVAAAGVWSSPAVAGGLSPHAPYSTSADLFAAAAATGRPLTIHAAEPDGEREFLVDGSGPFRRLLEALDKLPTAWRPPAVGTVAYLASLGCLGPRTSLVHCQHLESGDLELLARSSTPLVVCPGTVEWFDRAPPPVPQWLEAGLAVGLGTDSRASNDACCMGREVARASRLWPSLTPQELFEMGTCHGASALARPDLGRIRTGGRADFVALDGVWAQPDDAVADWVGGAVPAESRVVVAGGVVCEPPSHGADGASGLL